MILQSSFQSNPQIPEECLAARKMMNDIKGPILRQIEKAKTNFHSKVVKAEILSSDVTEVQLSRNTSQQQSEQNISSKCITEIGFNQQPRILTQSSCEEFVESKKEAYFGQWTLGKSKALFERTEDMISHYTRVFQQRVKFSAGKGRESFKLEQKQVIAKIFHEIGDIEQKTVDFSSIQSFFEQCPLFYRIYNIHPSSLKDVLNDSAHRHESKLTEEEFMNLFLLNNRTNNEYETYNVQNTVKKCVLDDETWKSLRDVFSLFDTFGNETIQLKQFFHKLKTSVGHKTLLQNDAVEFPTIKRSYPLKKVLFQLEHKLRIGDHYFRWGEIKSMIEDFAHIKSPTLDVIEKNYISSGVITSTSNNFMIKDQILDHLKDIFDHCPKYCCNFVKVSHFCMEFLESQKSRYYISEVVRNLPEIVTVKQILNSLTSNSLDYLDLDEIIQWFSIKGFQRQNRYSKRASEASQSSEEEEEIEKRILQIQKARKSIQNLPRKHNRINSKDITHVQEFSLSKKSKETIRDKKVKMMIQESQAKEIDELSKKFKANPIPSSINSQRYQEYRNQMNEKRQAILLKLNQVKEKDIMVLQYLQSNTKIFQKPKAFQPEDRKEPGFKAEPIPWFVHTYLQEQIDSEKEQKRRETRKQNRMKYLKEWKKLPSFILRDNSPESAVVTRNQSQKTLLKELQLNEEGFSECKNSNLTKKSKVKEVPNFKLLQKQFIEQLQMKKKHFQPTITEEFHLSSPRLKQNLISTEKVPKAAWKQKRPLNQSSNNFIGSTLKYESMMKANFEKRILEELQRQQTIAQAKKKEKEREIFAKLVRKQMKKDMKSKKKNNKKLHSRANSVECDNKREMADMYRRVFSRPFLFQEGSSGRKDKESMSKRAKPIDMGYPMKNKCIQKLHPHELQDSESVYEEALERSNISRKSL